MPRMTTAFLKKHNLEHFTLSIGKEVAKQIDDLKEGATFAVKLGKVTDGCVTIVGPIEMDG